jgi:hypothetical protein
MFYRMKSLLSVCAASLMVALPAAAQTSRSAVAHTERMAAVAPVKSPVQMLLEAGRARVRSNTAAAATLNYPYGLTVDVAGNLYAANLFAGVNIYNAKLQYQGAITAGVAIPAAVGVNFEGNIFVANNQSGTITVYNPARQQIATITDPNLNYPDGLYIDPDDTIWVLDGQGAVHAYLDNYAPLPTTQTGGTAIGPWGSNVTVWGISNGAGGYIEDFGNRDEMVRNNPAFPSYFPSGSPLAGGETQDAVGQQYVTDYAHNQVQIWSTSSQFMTGVINTSSWPAGIAVDSVRNRIYVALPAVNEIVVYSRLAPYKQLAVIH